MSIKSILLTISEILETPLKQVKSLTRVKPPGTFKEITEILMMHYSILVGALELLVMDKTE